MLPFDFGQNLKNIRLQKKLTQKQLHAITGLKSISGYETNNTKPSIEALTSLCLALNVSADTVLGLQKHETIIVDGLTDEQKNILNAIINSWRK